MYNWCVKRANFINLKMVMNQMSWKKKEGKWQLGNIKEYFGSCLKIQCHYQEGGLWWLIPNLIHKGSKSGYKKLNYKYKLQM